MPPTLLYLKLSSENVDNSKILDFISAGYIALLDLIRQGHIRYLLVSLIDLVSEIELFKRLTTDLFSQAKAYDVTIVLDSGCLEAHMISGSNTKEMKYIEKIMNPYFNLKCQLKCLPNIAILPDWPNNIEKNFQMLYDNKLNSILHELRKNRVKIAFVFHGFNSLKKVDDYLSKMTNAPCFDYIDQICIPDKDIELNERTYNLIKHIQNKLHKEIALLGVSSLDSLKLDFCYRYNIKWCDIIKWNYRMLSKSKNFVEWRNISYKSLNELVYLLKLNLLIINNLVSKDGDFSSNY